MNEPRSRAAGYATLFRINGLKEITMVGSIRGYNPYVLGPRIPYLRAHLSLSSELGSARVGGGVLAAFLSVGRLGFSGEATERKRR